jgi:hypothetical protein
VTVSRTAVITGVAGDRGPAHAVCLAKSRWEAAFISDRAPGIDGGTVIA